MDAGSKRSEAVVGLGSVGGSIVELLFRTLRHPRGLVLCDLYVKAGDLEELRQGIQDRFHFDGAIDVVAGDAGLPSAVRETRLIVSAVDRVGVINPLELAPGTILLDNSYPPTFDPAAAWRRMNESKDVVIASGGFARLPGPVRETFYVPNSARPFLSAYGEENFIREFQREPCDYTACIFAGPLALQDPALQPEIGIPRQQHWRLSIELSSAITWDLPHLTAMGGLFQSRFSLNSRCVWTNREPGRVQMMDEGRQAPAFTSSIARRHVPRSCGSGTRLRGRARDASDRSLSADWCSRLMGFAIARARRA